MQLWLYLHFPTLQLDAIFSEQEQQPLIIVDGKIHTIVQVNPQAKEKGINVGMGLASAAALCADLQVHPYDEAVEQKTLLDIAQWIYVVTSDIVIHTPNGLLLKLTNMLSLYTDLEGYWRTLSSHLNKLKLTYQYSTGFSPFSAMLLAKSGANIIEQDKQRLTEQVHRYPLTATELSVKQVSQLQRLGISSIADLIALPLPDIARRFNIDLVNYVGRLLGQFKHPVNFYHPPQQFCSYVELLFDINNVQWLEKPLHKLLAKLELFLTLRNQVAYELTLTLHHRDKPDAATVFTSASGDYFAAKWQVLCRLTMESLRLDAPVQGLTLTITRSGQLESTSQDLFFGQKGQQTELELISLLQAKLTQGSIKKVRFTDDPRPEKSTELCEPVSAEALANKRSSHHKHTQTKEEQFDQFRLRPSFMFPTPEPLTEEIEILQGPERIVSGWWDGDEMIRDYFVARSHTGRWLWVFRNQDKHWFLHGQFS